MHYEFVDHDLLTEMERTAYGKGDTTTAQLLGKLIEAQDMIEGLRQDQEDSEVVRQDLRDEIKDLRADFKTIRTALTELQKLTDGY